MLLFDVYLTVFGYLQILLPTWSYLAGVKKSSEFDICVARYIAIPISPFCVLLSVLLRMNHLVHAFEESIDCDRFCFVLTTAGKTSGHRNTSVIQPVWCWITTSQPKYKCHFAVSNTTTTTTSGTTASTTSPTTTTTTVRQLYRRFKPTCASHGPQCRHLDAQKSAINLQTGTFMSHSLELGSNKQAS